MDKFQAMRSVLTVASEGSFSRAAERLGISPQLVSKQVAQLERELGVRLFNRTTRRVHLTEAGARYCERAQDLVEGVDHLESELGELQGTIRGRLRVSAPVSFATRHLAPLLMEFQRDHPAVSIDLQLNDRKVDIVEEGFDVALRVGQLPDSSLIARRVAPVRMAICASPAYLAAYGVPENLEDLRGHRYLRYAYEDSAGPAGLQGVLRSNPGGATGELLSNNGDVLLEAAIRGAGVVVQPTFIVGSAIASGQLKIILPDHEPKALGLYAVYAHRTLLASKVRQFVDFLGGYFGDPPYWDRFERPGS